MSKLFKTHIIRGIVKMSSKIKTPCDIYIHSRFGATHFLTKCDRLQYTLLKVILQNNVIMLPYYICKREKRVKFLIYV